MTARSLAEELTAPRSLAECGTHAAYMRHRRHGEVPCRDCVDGANVLSFWRRRRLAHAAVEQIIERRPDLADLPWPGAYAVEMVRWSA